MQAIRLSYFLLLFSLFSSTHGKLKILGLFPLNSVSHFQFFHPLLKKLAETGHSVDVVSPFPSRNHPPTYKDYVLSSISMTNRLHFDIFEDTQMKIPLPFDEFFFLHVFGIKACNHTLNSNALAQILKKPKGYYDVIILEQFNTDCMMGVAHQLRAPVIAMSSCAMMPWHYKRMGAPIITSYMPVVFHGQSQYMDFKGRLINWLATHAFNWLYNRFTVPADNELLRLKFGAGLPSTVELVKNTSLLLLNQHYSLSGSRPLPPNIIEVSGMHMEKVKPLSKELQQLLDNASEHGAIVISWGSSLLATTLSSAKRVELLRALSRLPQQIIWKWENDTLDNQPENVHIMKWLPQRDILCHPNVKVFFTHGGLMGLTEAVTCGVPVVGMPLFGDQFLNVANLVQLQMAVQLDFKRFDEHSVFEALFEATDPSYKLHAEQVATAYNERLEGPLETAMWWVEHVAETRGAPLLQSSAVHLNYFVYYSLDIYIVLAIFFLVLNAFCFSVWRYICAFLQRKSKQKKT